MLNNMKIGTRLIISPIIAIVFLVILAIFSNNALKSDKQTLNEIVEVKFQLYKDSSKLLIDVELYNSVLYKIFSFATDGYAQSQIDEQLAYLDKIKKQIEKDMVILSKSSTLAACRFQSSKFALISSSVNIGRVESFPVGSPIRTVPFPISKTTFHQNLS